MELLTAIVNKINFDFPAFMLIIGTIGLIWILNKTQKRDDFDLADMLRGEDGKASSSRLASFVCLGVSSWGLMYMLVKSQGPIDNWLFLGYCGIWSGVKAVEKAIDAYAASKGSWNSLRDRDDEPPPGLRNLHPPQVDDTPCRIPHTGD